MPVLVDVEGVRMWKCGKKDRELVCLCVCVCARVK